MDAVPPIHVSPLCPIRTALELIGGKWKLLLLFQISHQPLRPSELRRSIPDISEKILLQELAVMLRNGLIDRHEKSAGQKHVTYQITKQGQAALPLLEAMKDFADRYVALK